ncbi:hypothetical protein HPK01_03020 [Anoxybacillus flavithermus]|nr:hypothetical protein [Anoxybacillus flavithermus]MBE2907165.1 hypothetical protein [Anoxybacillus flavithermus]
MIELRIEEGLLLATLQLTHKNQTIELKRALIDTGSTGTIVSADQAATI